MPDVTDIPPAEQGPPVSENPNMEEKQLHSFSDWLSIVARPPVKPEPETEHPAADEKILIEKFIRTSPRLSPPKENAPHVDISLKTV